MTLKELKELLETSQMPVAFNHFKTAQKLPYIVYIIADNNQLAADNVVYHSDPFIQVELYTERKDMDSEATVFSFTRKRKDTCRTNICTLLRIGSLFRKEK